jgi:death-on-curing protein
MLLEQPKLSAFKTYMKNPKWLTIKQVLYLHDYQIETTGGDPGIIDIGQLESTIFRPQQTFNYNPEADIFDLSASLGFGLAKNHCFVDGNKRTALNAMDVFLRINRYKLSPPEPEAVNVILDVVNNLLSQDELSLWLSHNSKPIT